MDCSVLLLASSLASLSSMLWVLCPNISSNNYRWVDWRPIRRTPEHSDEDAWRRAVLTLCGIQIRSTICAYDIFKRWHSEDVALTSHEQNGDDEWWRMQKCPHHVTLASHWILYALCGHWSYLLYLCYCTSHWTCNTTGHQKEALAFNISLGHQYAHNFLETDCK